MLLQSVKMQLSIIFKKKGFMITFGIVLLYVMIVYLYYVFLFMGKDATEIVHPASLSALISDGRYTWQFIQYYVYLLVLPASFILMTDKEINILPIVQIRQGIGTYYVAKAVAAFIATFIVFTVPFLIQLLMNALSFPLQSTQVTTGMPPYSEMYFNYSSAYWFEGLFHYNRFLYCIASILLFGVYSGIVSAFLTALSTLNIRFKVFLFLPYFLFGYFFSYINEIMPFLHICSVLETYLLLEDATIDKKFSVLLFIMLSFVLLTIIFTTYSVKKEPLN